MKLAVIIGAPVGWIGFWYVFYAVRAIWRNTFCGRRVCAWCKADMGCARDLKRGQVTHGICPTCSKQWAVSLPTP